MYYINSSQELKNIYIMCAKIIKYNTFLFYFPPFCLIVGFYKLGFGGNIGT